MLNPGDIIAQKYQIVRLIGQGGMSNVYLCRRLNAPANDQQWVIKEMTVSYRDPEDQKRAVDQFEREASLLQKLHHKNLPRVIDRFVLGNRNYFVMEYVEGEDLGKLLTRNPDGLAEGLVVKWAIECATVLYYLHAQKPPIVFRDVKPSNIMISRGSVKIIDFGIARNFDAFKKKDTMRIGSPGYAPPEQYSGQTDARSDIYSLGVTLHQLVTGRDPSETQTPFKLPPVRTINPRISPGLESIIMRATEMEPTRRYRTALDMKRALQELIGVRTGPIGSPTGPVGPLPVVAPAPPVAAAPTVPAPPRQVAQALGGPTNVPSLQTPKSGTVPYLSPPGAPRGAPLPGTPGGPPVPAASLLMPAGAPQRPTGPTPPAPPLATTGVPAAAAPKVAFAAQAPARPGLVRRMLPLLLLLIVLGGGVGILWFSPQVVQTIKELPQVKQLMNHLWGGGGGNTTGANTTGGESPEALPSDVPHRALFYENRNDFDKAMTLLEQQPSTDPLAIIAYNNGLAQLEPNDKVTLAVLVPQAEPGPQWLRGVALAQRQQNERGGVNGHLLVLRPYDYAWPPAADATLPAVSELKDAAPATVLGLLPLAGAAAPPLRQGLRDASVPLLEDVDAPSLDVMSAAMLKVIGKTIKAAHVVVVALPGVDSAAASKFDDALKADKDKAPGVRLVDVNGQSGAEEIKTIIGLKPDLIVLLGDAVYASRYHAALLEQGYAGALLSPPVSMTTASTSKADSWVLSPYAADSKALPDQVFTLDYDGMFERSSRPGYWAARGYDTVRGWSEALADAGAPTAATAQSALEAAATHKLEGLAGPLLSKGGATTIYLQHWHGGAWQTVDTIAAEAQ